MQSPDATRRPLLVLVPGAWMGAWIWDDTVERLGQAGWPALTVTLAGLQREQPADRVAGIRLADHVDQLTEFVIAADSPVILVGHSYSGIVVGQVADRLPELVPASIHISTFLPRNGRSLIDDWGPDPQARRAERDQIIDDGTLWAPPPAPALEGQPDLTAEQRRWLAGRFVPHPGRTVLEPADMSRPITDQAITYISTAESGADPLDDLPPEIAGGPPDRWQLRTLAGGHWPMLTNPVALVDALVETALSAEADSRS